MTAVYGLLPTGFNPKTLDDVKTDVESRLRAAFGQSIDLAPQSVFGIFVGIICDLVSELWDLAQAVNASTDPDAATDTSLDAVCAITGTVRDGARAGFGIATLTGTPGTLLLIGRVISVLLTGTRFTTQAAVTIASVPAWAASTPYIVGDRVTLAGRVYQYTIAGVSNAGSGPATLFAGISDGSATCDYLGQGSGAIDVLVIASAVGPFPAVARTLTVIETPVSGWLSAINVLDIQIGANVELDPPLRNRREVELEASSNATLAAIRAKVLKVGKGTNNPVTSCSVFQNTTMLTNVDGLPPKSVEVLAQGGADAEIFETVLDSVAAGIETYGNQSAVIPDAAGNDQTIKFSRPNAFLIYATFTVTVDVTVFAATGAADIAAAVVAYGNTYPVGKDVRATALGARAFVPGVLDVPTPFIGVAPAPATSTTIVCGNHDQAKFDTSRITVNVTPGSV